MDAGAEQFFADCPLGMAALQWLTDQLDTLGPYDVRVSKSQVALWRRHGFAYLWRPDQYLRHPAAQVVLSLALDRPLDSPRFKQVVEPAPHHWMHHLVLRALTDLDDEVAAWLAAAHAAAV